MFSSQSKDSTGKKSGASLRSEASAAETASPNRTYGAAQAPSTTSGQDNTSMLSRILTRSAPGTLGNNFSSRFASPAPPMAEQRPPPSPSGSLQTGTYRVSNSPRLIQSKQSRPTPPTMLQPRPLTPERRQQARLGNLRQLPTSTTAQALTPREKEFRRAPFVCEFLGTAMFAFAVSCCKFCGNEYFEAATIGVTFMVLVYAVGPASGGNLNPAVSFTLALLGKLRWPVAAGYILVQTVGAFLGTTVAKVVLFSHATPRFLVAPEAPYLLREAAAVEGIFTAMLCFVVACCVVSDKNNPAKDQNQFYGLAIGSAVIAGGYATGNISGGILNPALAISLNNPDIKEGISYGFEYAGFEMLGACTAAALYCMCRPSFEDEEDGRQFGDQVSSHSLGTRIASEFIGTLFLALTVGFCLVLGSPTTTPLATAAALMSMVYAVGTVSGGHFNPAVTLAVVLGGRDKCDMPVGCLYVVVQIIAGVASGIIVTLVHGFTQGMPVLSVLSPKMDYTWTESFAAEMVFTALLAYVVLTVTTTPALPSYTRQHFYFGLTVGACYIVGGFAIGAISGGVLNPAVATGVAAESSLIVSFSKLWKPSYNPLKSGHLLVADDLRIGAFGQIQNLFQFTMAEMIGGTVAAGVFGLTHPQEFDNRFGSPKLSAGRELREDDPSLALL